jgi:hypothetical protein
MFTPGCHHTFVSLSSFINSFINNFKTEVIMKTLKITLIAAILACTMVSLANADGFTGKPKALKVLNLTIQKAVTVPGLVAAMVEQLDPQELLDGSQAIYVGEVTLNGTLYRISGTREQWILFFYLHPKVEKESPVNTKWGIG